MSTSQDLPPQGGPAGQSAAPAVDLDVPALVPLLAPLTPRQEVLHQIRNRLTYIAGTAHLLRRRSKLGTLDRETEQVRLEQLENAVWQVNALLDEAESD